MKKYEFTGETMVRFGVTLKKIRALVEIKTLWGTVNSGDEGGWIEKEDNLSHNGDAWVYGNALVYGNARVCGDARVYGDAWVCGNARVYGNARVCGDARVCVDARVYGNALVYGNARVCGDARVYGDAWVYGDARVCGDARVYGNARVYGDAWVYGNALVYGNARVYGNALVYGNAEVSCNASHFEIGPIGSRNDTTTFFWTKEKKIFVSCGCFRGDIDAFRKKVRETHGDNEHAKAYLIACDLAELRIGKADKEEAKDV